MVGTLEGRGKSEGVKIAVCLQQGTNKILRGTAQLVRTVLTFIQYSTALVLGSFRVNKLLRKSVFALNKWCR